MSMKTIIPAMAGAILIAALVLFLRHEPPPGADAASSDRSTPRQTETLPTARPPSPETTAAANAAPSRSEATDQPGALPPQPSPPTPITEAIEELKLPPVPEILETERAFAAEAVDPRWSSEAETHILSEIAQVTGLKLITLRVECKTTLCRLHVAQQELSRAAPFQELVGRLGLNPLWVVTVVDRNGVPTSLAYLERQSAAPKGTAE